MDRMMKSKRDLMRRIWIFSIGCTIQHAAEPLFSESGIINECLYLDLTTLFFGYKGKINLTTLLHRAVAIEYSYM